MADLTEFGSSGLKQTGGFIYEEFLPVLRGRRGALVYREMNDNDPIVGAYVFALEKVIQGLDWRVDPAEVEGREDEAADVATFGEECLHDMSQPWEAVLSDIITMIPYGWSFQEIVYKRRGGDSSDPKSRSKYDDNKIGWRKFAPRAQDTLVNWDIDPEDGGIRGMIQMDPYSQGKGGTVTIPIEKALLFRTTAKGGNPEGRSMLRNAYRPWYFKKRIEEIEAIGVERDLAGLPVGWVPPEYLTADATPAQKAVLTEVTKIVQNIKRNEQEGVVFPMVYDEKGHKVFDLTLMSSGGQRQFDTDKIVARYDQRMAMTMLADFLLLGHEAVGSKALGVSKIDLWELAVDSIANSIAEVVNSHAFPRLMRLNGIDPELTPKLSYGEVGSIDLTALADYVQKVNAAGALTPDESLEGYLREIAGLPPADEPDESEIGSMLPPVPGVPPQMVPQDPTGSPPPAPGADPVAQPPPAPAGPPVPEADPTDLGKRRRGRGRFRRVSV